MDRFAELITVKQTFGIRNGNATDISIFIGSRADARIGLTSMNLFKRRPQLLKQLRRPGERFTTFAWALAVLSFWAAANRVLNAAEQPRDDEKMIEAREYYKGQNFTDEQIARAFATNNFIPKHISNYFRGMDVVSVPIGGGADAVAWPDQLLDKTNRPPRSVVDIVGKLRTSRGDYVETDALQSEVFGRNTWMIWCGGNEAFWDWLANHSLGFMDLLKVLDSRTRATRWRDGGIVNEPEMRETAVPQPDEFGLWLDQPEQERHRQYRRKVLAEMFRGETGQPQTKGNYYADDEYPEIPPWRIYGLSSGVVGLRLFPNPAFTGEARKKWNATNYYNKTNYYSDPELVRPFRVGMSCAFCHASAHPLNPPPDPSRPRWENLSASIGSQYLRIRSVFGNLLPTNNFVYHLLDSQPPGTIDTSLIASDNINNPNTMNAIFAVPQRVQRALANPRETLHGDSAGMPLLSASEKQPYENPRPVPRILLDGADTIGVWGALARVYLNIGTYSEQWIRLHEPLVGFLPPAAATNPEERRRTQLPFKIKDCQEHSVYWQATRLRVEPLRDYFLKITPTMPLLDAHGPSDVTNRVKTNLLARGRGVFARNCIVCHSSIQPENNPLDLFDNDPADLFHQKPKSADIMNQVTQYERAWGALGRERYYNLTNWAGHGEFWDHDPGRWLRDPTYTNWAATVVEWPEFWRNNFLSTDYRVSVAEVGTNPGRALANNATKDHMWEDFASASYKTNAFADAIKYFNPYSGPEGETNTFKPRHRVAEGVPPGGGGPGFYRPATLISVWATAPLLHNNSLGLFNNDPSVRGRLAAFNNAIHMLLTAEDRRFNTNYTSAAQWKKDHGLIWRTPSDTYLILPAKHVPAFARRVPWPHSLDRLARWLEELGRWKLLPSAALLLAAFVLLWKSKGKRSFWQRIGGYTAMLAAILLGFLTSFLAGRLGDVQIGPIPAGTPVNLLANINPDASRKELKAALHATVNGLTEIQTRQLQGAEKANVFRTKIAPALLNVSKCPDFVMDKGHYFPWFKDLSPDEKEALIELLKTF